MEVARVTWEKGVRLDNNFGRLKVLRKNFSGGKRSRQCGVKHLNCNRKKVQIAGRWSEARGGMPNSRGGDVRGRDHKQGQSRRGSLKTRVQKSTEYTY